MERAEREIEGGKGEREREMFVRGEDSEVAIYRMCTLVLKRNVTLIKSNTY